MTLPNKNQNPPDIEDVLAQLEALPDSDDSDGQPAEGQDGDISFPDTDDGKKQAHAFARQGKLLRQAKAVIKSLKEKPLEPAHQTPPQPPASGRVDATAQANALMYQLQLEAIQNTGIADPQHPLVVLEINRLYSDKVAQLRTRNEAGTKAPKVFTSVAAMPQFKRLTPDDLEEIQTRVRTLNPESQADEQVVKTVFNLYIGENFDRFVNPPSGGKPPEGDDDAGAAASSSARSRGRGVPTGTPGGGGAGVQPPKPPNEQEAREMRQIGLDPFVAADVVRYRSASKRRGTFTSS